MPERREAAEAAGREDWDDVLVVLGRHWSVLASDPVFVRDILDRVPRHVLSAAPRWITARSHLEHMMDDAPSDAPPADGPDVLDELSRLTARIVDARARGRLVSALSDLELARLRLDRATDAELVAVRHARPYLLHQWARVYELAERTTDARVLLHEATEGAELIGDAATVRHAAGRLAWIDAVTGRHASSARWADLAERQPVAGVRVDVERGLARALTLADAMETEAAQALLDASDPEADARESWAARQFAIAHACTTATAPAALDDLLETEASRPPELARTGLNLLLLTHAKVRLLLLAGDTSGALRVSADLPDRPGLLVARGAALLAADQNQAVLAISRRVRDLVDGHPRWRTKLAAIEGVALARLGAEPAAAAIGAQLAESIPRLGLYSALTLLTETDLEHLLGSVGTEPADEMRRRVLTHLSSRVVVRLSRLSPRERTVLRSVVEGRSLDEVAAELFVSRNTVKSQMSSIYRKFDVSSREQLIALAHRLPLDGD